MPHASKDIVRQCAAQMKGLPVDRVFSMPRAAQAMPNMLAREKLTKMAMAMTVTGMMADWYPRARPKMMLVAAPVLHASATSCSIVHAHTHVLEIA